MQIFIHCKDTLHGSGVTAPIIRSTKNCNRNLRYQYLPHDSQKPVPIRQRWREVAVPILWPVPEVTVTVFSTPDDGCCDTRNMKSDFAVNKYLHTVASGWICINIVCFNFILPFKPRSSSFFHSFIFRHQNLVWMYLISILDSAVKERNNAVCICVFCTKWLKVTHAKETCSLFRTDISFMELLNSFNLTW